MKANHNEFNAKKGQALKEAGLRKNAQKNRAWLEMARARVVKLCKKHGYANSDMLQKSFPRFDKEGNELASPNTVGNVFNVPYLVKTGDWQRSCRVSAHRRIIWNYRYGGSAQ